MEVFGLPPETDEAAVRAVDPWGKTDRWILREMLGYRPDDEDVARWERAACAAYEALEHGDPGDDDRRTAAVLERLHAAGHELALVTGNLEPIARRKLERRGLGGWFPSDRGGFGSDGEARADLVRIARERAGAWPREDTVLIGDTPLDVAAAIEAGVRAIGVAGGRYSQADLLEAGASAAVSDLDELDDLL